MTRYMPEDQYKRFQEWRERKRLDAEGQGPQPDPVWQAVARNVGRPAPAPEIDSMGTGMPAPPPAPMPVQVPAAWLRPAPEIDSMGVQGPPPPPPAIPDEARRNAMMRASIGAMAAPPPSPPPPEPFSIDPAWQAAAASVGRRIAETNAGLRQGLPGYAGAADVLGQAASGMQSVAAPQAETLYGPLVRREVGPGIGPHGLPPVGESIVRGVGRFAGDFAGAAQRRLATGQEAIRGGLGEAAGAASQRWEATEAPMAVRGLAEMATPLDIAAGYLPLEKAAGPAIGVARAGIGAAERAVTSQPVRRALSGLDRIAPGLRLEDVSKAAGAAGEAAGPTVENGARLFDASGNLMGKPTKVEAALDSGLVVHGRESPALREILGPRGETLSVVGQPGSAVARTAAAASAVGIAKLSPEVRQQLPNIAKLKNMPEVVQTLVGTAQSNPGLIEKFRRGTITHEELINDLAPRLGMTADDFLKRGVGRAFNETELLALRAAVVQKSGQLADLASRAAERGGIGAMSDAEKVAALSDLVDAARLQAVARGAASTAGRALNQQKIVIDRAMAEAITGSNERIAAQQAARAAEQKLAAAKARADVSAAREAERELLVAQRRQERAGALAARASTRQQEQARRIIENLGGRTVTEDVLRNWLAVQQSGDSLAAAKFLRGLQNVSWWDRLGVIRYGSMLSATSTHLTNTLSNAIQLGMDVGLKPLAVAIDIPRAALTGTERTRYLAEIGPQLRGMLDGLFTGAKEAGVVMRTGVDPAEAGKLEKVRAGFALGQTRLGELIGQRASNVVDIAAELPLRALVAADKIIRGTAYGGQVQALAVRQATREGYSGAQRAARANLIMQNITEFPELLVEAERSAARVVLQESREEAGWLAQGRNVPALGKPFEVAVPFVRTPYNIAAQGAGMTPAGFLSTIKAARDGYTGEAVDRAARALFGTAVMGVGTSLAAAGFLTGAYPADPAQRSTLPPGWQPWSVRIPDASGGARYVSFQNLGPVGIPLAIGALYGEAQRKGQPITDVATHAEVAAGVGKYMVDQTFARGVFDMLRALEQPDRYAENVVENWATQAVPYGSLQRQMTRALDISARDPHGAIEALLALNPVTAGRVGERRTPMGEPLRREPTGIAAFVSPLKVTTERDEPALQALRQAEVGIPGPPSTAHGYSLTDQESGEVQRRAGEYMRQWIGPMQADPSFRKLPKFAQQKVLGNLRDSARKAATAEVLSRISGEELQQRSAVGGNKQ